jgi:uncharacterized repeat protein (TIGR03803 family)
MNIESRRKAAIDVLPLTGCMRPRLLPSRARRRRSGMWLKNRVVMLGFLAFMVSGLAARLNAQNFTTLYSFVPDPDTPNGGPNSGLALSGSTLYGTAGCVFRLNTDGSDFLILASFISYYGPGPMSALTLSLNTLYGVTHNDGPALPAGGTVFAVSTSGTDSTTLYDFDPAGVVSGNNPFARLVLSDGRLYGTTFAGGSGGIGAGTVFAINTDGTGCSNLHLFPPGNDPSDGSLPTAGLVLAGNTLYGTTSSGGSATNGIVFALKTDGTGFRVLHSFTGGSDGAAPMADLVLSGDTLYGTAAGGGSSGNGTVFRVNTDGTNFTALYQFSPTDLNGVNSDGSQPQAGLILSGDTLYGTAAYGGSSGNGTVFQLNTDGTGFTNLHSFTAIDPPDSFFGTNSDGAQPQGEVILSSNILYGTAYMGGSYGLGTVFSISLPQAPPPEPPRLTISPGGNSVILTWPLNATSFTLQATTNLTSPVWTTNLPAPVVINGQNTVTNPISGSEQFFRLSQ